MSFIGDLVDPLSLLSPLGGTPPLGLAQRFGVVVGGLNLGFWSSCKGLAVNLKPDVATPLGVNGYRQILMPTIEYPPITLERAVDGKSSPTVQQWLTQEITNWYSSTANGQPYAGETATITLFDYHADSVMTWSLQGVYPTKWTGPTLSSASGVALESLELTHEGFLQVNV
jgi:phage tail-like protein